MFELIEIKTKRNRSSFVLCSFILDKKISKCYTHLQPEDRMNNEQTKSVKNTIK